MSRYYITKEKLIDFINHKFVQNFEQFNVKSKTLNQITDSMEEYFTDHLFTLGYQCAQARYLRDEVKAGLSDDAYEFLHYIKKRSSDYYFVFVSGWEEFRENHLTKVPLEGDDIGLV